MSFYLNQNCQLDSIFLSKTTKKAEKMGWHID